MIVAAMATSDRPLRVVSLLSASTEIVARLGMAHCLVGISHECDYPQSVMQLPSCSEPNMDPNASSVAIDTAVRDIVKAGRCVYTIYADRLAQLKANVIITQDQCRVCAVSEPQLREAVESWASSCQATCAWTDGQAVVGGDAVKIISLVPHSIADICGDVTNIATALGVPERGRRVVAWMQKTVQGVRDAVAELAGVGPRPRVALLEWIDPIMGSGHWHPELAEAAGAECLWGDPGGHVATLSLADLAASDPDCIIFAPCGFDLKRSAKDLGEAEYYKSAEWEGMRCVREGRVFVADGLTYFNRSSPRVVQSAEIVAEALHYDLAGLWGHTGSTLLTLQQALEPKTFTLPAHLSATYQTGSGSGKCCG